MKPWSKFSWKNYIVQQQPKWPNSEDYNQVIKELSTYPPLIFAKEADKVQIQDIIKVLDEAVKYNYEIIFATQPQ